MEYYCQYTSVNFIYFESKLNDFDLLIKYSITHTEVTRYENSKKNLSV